MAFDYNDGQQFKPEQDYETALRLLENPDKTANAVYLLEKAAQAGYAPACMAMAWLFEEGKYVSKSKKSAVAWYQKAAELGDADAKRILNELERKSRRRIILTAVTAILIVALAAAAVYIFCFSGLLKPSDGISIKLPPDASLEEHDDIGEYGVSLNKLTEQYDTDAMKNGDINTYRILLRYNGTNLDLSSYHVVAAIVSDKLITLQFETAEDAEACFDYLNSLPDTSSVAMDRYKDIFSSAAPSSYSASSPGMTTEHSDDSGYDYYTWGAKAMNMDKYAAYLRQSGLSDKKVTVAVIDSGFDARDEIVNDFGRDRIEDGLNVLSGLACDYDIVGHGTHVCSTILDCTRGLNVVIYPIGLSTDSSPNPTDSAILLGIEKAAEIGADVVNMSLGGPEFSSQSIEDDLIRETIRENGTTFVVAAGNDTVNCEDNRDCPAHIDECITVAAVDKAVIPAFFSNFGDCVDIAAPGVDILSYLPYDIEPAGYAEWPGTSMATPHITALAAMIRTEYDLEPKYVEAYIKAIGSGTLTKDGQNYGEGLPDASKLVEHIKP